MGKVTRFASDAANDSDGLASAVSEAKFSACVAKRKVRYNQGVNPPSKALRNWHAITQSLIFRSRKRLCD
jgi:hypothetical protein